MPYVLLIMAAVLLLLRDRAPILVYNNGGFSVRYTWTQYRDFMVTYAAQYRVPLAWIYAIICTEQNDATQWDPKVHSNAGAFGLGQLLPKYSRNLGYKGPDEGLYDPETNIHYCAALLRDQINRIGMDFDENASMYYSGGATYYKTNPEVMAYVVKARHFLSQFPEV